MAYLQNLQLNRRLTLRMAQSLGHCLSLSLAVGDLSRSGNLQPQPQPQPPAFLHLHLFRFILHHMDPIK